MPFECKYCGYFINKDIGAPYTCPKCKNKAAFIRVPNKKSQESRTPRKKIEERVLGVFDKEISERKERLKQLEKFERAEKFKKTIKYIKQSIILMRDLRMRVKDEFCRSSSEEVLRTEAMRTTEVHDRQKGGVNEKCK